MSQGSTTRDANRNGRSRSRRLALAGIVLSAVFAANSALGQSAKTSDDEFRQKYRQAAALAGEKKHAEAKKLFLELWAKAKSHEVATSLGQIELVTQHYANAAQYLSYAVGTYPAHQDEKQLTVLRKWLEQAKKHVATYEIVTNVPGATVNVDGVDFGNAPLDVPLFLESGRHLVMVTADGYKRADRSFMSTEGTSDKLEINLAAAEKHPAPVPGATRTPPPQPNPPIAVQPLPEPPRDSAASKPNPWVLVGGGAITVAGLVTGLVLHAKASSEYDKAQTLRGELGASGCYIDASSTKCTDQMTHLDSGDRDNIASGVAFGIGGAALVATAAYWFWPRSRSAKAMANEPALAVSTGPSGTWLGVSGKY